MTKIYLIEDDLTHLTYIKKTISMHLNSENMTYSIQEILDIAKFKKNISQTQISDNDIFFIDIQLSQYFNGIDLAAIIRAMNSNCFIIFLTGEKNRTLEVINKNISPFGYIIKSNNNIQTIELQLIEMLNKIYVIQTEDNTLIRFKSFNEDLLISLSEINYLTTIKGDRFHTYMQTAEEEHIINDSFVNIKKISFPEYYITSFKSYIINTHQIKSLSRKSGEVIFKNNHTLYLSPLLISKLIKLLGS
ncbi:LytR/AlgR family response regulator transcription factor [Enterococcus faecalis]|uniref:LytR/AlgR family response regulator transcription factor n=1 Tax=Enterococcus faecalis TaxID=1351 RepID=UPI00115CF6ED|nr:LytTR family transcriptional regulator DNA-binding domain-containing protein [Enterococcus faecalis]